MKCLILAGGKGNSVWPLSREEYPKQFMKIRKNRSLLQETVARNLPFCDEFLITTNASYYFIAEGQMKVFQGLQYRCILEEAGRKTAPAIAIACMAMNPSELVYVVSADQIIEGTDYKETVLRGQQLAREGRLVTFGMEALYPNTAYGYIRNQGERVLEFKEKPDAAAAQKYHESGAYLWNSGNFLFCAGAFLNELKKTAPDVYEACDMVHRKIHMNRSAVRLPARLLERIPAVSVEEALFERSDNVYVVKAAFYWWDVGNPRVLSSYLAKEEQRNVIRENCRGVSVVNEAQNKLVVVTDGEDIIVLNTEDACYITSGSSGHSVKEVMHAHPEYSAFFEKARIVYRPWGTYEVLTGTANYKVKKVRVYPGKTLSMHRHALRSEQWSVLQGTATVALDGEVRDLARFESLTVPVGVRHMLSNQTEEDLIIVEVSFGPQVTEEDKESIAMPTIKRRTQESFVKCQPVFKDYLWGGTQLRDVYGKKCDYDIIAESWELSAHEAGQCRVASGKHKGMLFGEYLKLIGEDALGWKCQAFEKFPLLIKLIDAANPLSVQVHPDDSFALSHENEYGKNELWYVMDCEPGSFIYFGLNREITKEELRSRAVDNTITEVLNRVPVHRGDTFFVKAGTIHAIGKGILICEIQQNSNCTYRLYDYGRRDRFGNFRELHLDKAAEVAYTKGMSDSCIFFPLEQLDGYQTQKLCECKYFTSIRYDVARQATVTVDETSFVSIVILEGTGVLRHGEESMVFQPADSFFIHAGKKTVEVVGRCRFILTRL